ncbi:hypothetical protein WOLCODRAFT_98097 [Wolfiporia cocos MD-104 SS10]|uniref:Uncharacterized protein n=1 Tax=Wolfiporia cocos (strain MD-104) TaxID=742152 RepID=A0A2H3JV28_WOLCO|nr:hypothetical protein WOLCODRAFT_98097 [Wolfiporia cocos MD-104 SS10]
MIPFMIYALSLLLILAHGAPLNFDTRDVVDPPIISPNASTVWKVGEKVTVTWNTSGIPSSGVTDKDGMVVLGYLTVASEHLMIDDPLAQGFPLTDGKVSFVVPSVPTRTNYIVALFGDSGNISPTFTILGDNSTSTSAFGSPAASLTGSFAASSSFASSASASPSTSVVVTTQGVTSESVTTVPAKTSTDNIVTASPSAGRSAGTSVPPSATYAPSSVSTSASVPASTSVPITSQTAPPAPSSTSVGSGSSSDTSSTSGGWSWKVGRDMAIPSCAIAALVAFAML